MKNLKRFIAIVAVLTMMCMLLCSCNELDDMKKAQAFWTEENSIDTITMSNGDKYIKLDKRNDVMLDDSNWRMITVTTEDVPTLLSDEFGISLSVSDDNNFIYGYINENVDMIFSKKTINGYSSTKTGDIFITAEDSMDVTDEIGEVLYCKEDIYPEVSKSIKEGVEYTHYGYDYYTFDEATLTDNVVSYKLSDNEKKVIDTILEEVKPNHNDENLYNHNYLLTINNLSDNEIFGKYVCEIWISADKSTYYLAKYFEGVDTYDTYEVPDKYQDDLEEMAEDVVKLLDVHHTQKVFM